MKNLLRVCYALCILLWIFQTTAFAANHSHSSPAVRGSSTMGQMAPPKWFYGDTGHPKGYTWMVGRHDEAAQGVDVLWRHQSGIRIQVRRHPGMGRAMISLRFDITDLGTSLHRPVGVSEMIERGLIPGGLGRYTSAQAASFFAGSSVKLSGVKVSDDAITYCATCKGRDLTKALDLLRAYFGDPGWHKEAAAGVKKAWLDEISANRNNINAVVESRMRAALSDGLPWRCGPTAGQVKSLTFKEADQWLGKVLSLATLTVTIVGDVPANAAKIASGWLWQYNAPVHVMILSIDNTLQSLPTAAPIRPGVERVAISGPTRKSVVHVVWPTDDTFDIVRTRHLDVLARCFEDQLTRAVRARYGRSASVKVWNFSSENFRGEGQLHAVVEVPSSGTAQVKELILAEAQQLSTSGVNPSRFEQIKAGALEHVRKLKNDDSWWLSSVLPHAGSQPFRVYWAAHIDDDYRSSTPVSTHALAKQYLQNAKAFSVVGYESPESAKGTGASLARLSASAHPGKGQAVFAVRDLQNPHTAWSAASRGRRGR